MEAAALVILAVGGNKGILGVIKKIKNTIVQRQTSTQNGGDNDFLRGQIHLRDSQGSDNFLIVILHCPTYLIRKNLTQPGKIMPETERILLNGLVAHLRDKLIENRIGLSQIDNFHDKNILANISLCFNKKKQLI